jgi:hypothetical protein
MGMLLYLTIKQSLDTPLMLIGDQEKVQKVNKSLVLKSALLTNRIESEDNLSVLGKYYFGIARNVDNFICITSDIGLDDHIIINARLFRRRYGRNGKGIEHIQGEQHDWASVRDTANPGLHLPGARLPARPAGCLA